MSALDQLPPGLKARILSQERYLRDDLLAIPAAEAAGWTVEFRNNSWHNGATFKKGRTVVWSTGRDWRFAARQGNGYLTKPQVFANLAEALAATPSP